MKKRKVKRKNISNQKNMIKKFKFKKIKFRFYTFLLIFSLAISLLIYLFEVKVVPVAIVIGENYATNIVSQEIDKSVQNTINNLNLFTENFFNTSSSEGDNHFLDINTTLINNLCLNVSKNLTEELKNFENFEIKLPLGTILGFNIFSNFGPNFNLDVNSIGSATTDYETKFESVGINQINFQVFLNIKTELSIFSPLHKKNIVVTRKLMIVNTVFNGAVPNTYLNLPIS